MLHFRLIFISIYYRSLGLFLCIAPGPKKLRDYHGVFQALSSSANVVPLFTNWRYIRIYVPANRQYEKHASPSYKLYFICCALDKRNVTQH